MELKNYTWHRIIFRILFYTAGPLVKRYFGYSCKKLKGPDTASLVIANHNLDLDPALVALGFSRHMYFLSSEHALRAGFGSKILKLFFAPISINKAKTDVTSIKEIIRRLKLGASVCLFAEGDRSFNGVTSPIALSMAKLAKTSGADLITFRIVGGYFTSPRWAKKMRKGKMTGTLVNKYSAEQLKTMSVKELLGAIESDLYEDAYARQQMLPEQRELPGQKETPQRYKGKNLAENIETTLYVCPGCKKIGTLKSEGDRFYCGCGLSGVYTDTGYLEGDSLPFSTITEWDKWQTAELAEIIKNAGDKQICADEDQLLFEIRPATGKTLVGEGPMSIDREAFYCAGSRFLLEDITRIVVAGQMLLLFGLKEGASYEVRSRTPRSALKYREIFRLLTGA